MSDWYILEGHRPVRCNDLVKHAEWMATVERHVGDDTIALTTISAVVEPDATRATLEPAEGAKAEKVRVSTVFLGLDHGVPGLDRGPMLFETLIFGGTLDGYGQRYSTWDEAEVGHRMWLERVRTGWRDE